MRFAKLLAAAVMGMAVSAAWAEGDASAKPQRRPGAGAGLSRADVYKTMLENLTKQLNLTADQQAQVREKITTFQQEMENLRKEMGGGQKLRDQLAKARQENDTKTVEAIGAQLAERRKKFTEMRTALNEQIAGVLDEKQKEQFARMNAERAAGGQRTVLSVVDTLELTPEQRKAITEAVMKILTDEQKEQLKKRLAEAPAVRGRRGAGPKNPGVAGTPVDRPRPSGNEGSSGNE